ncbi:hypothetical protein [Niveibacterium sp. SC-1]|uniref:hypothetical protein n=1 Tax=Niveibacterium sp. SC-1 TaxID=3135646 RepID=UPI00311DC587
MPAPDPESTSLLGQLSFYGLGAWGSALALARARHLGLGGRVLAFTTALGFSQAVPPLVAYYLHWPAALLGPLAFLCGFFGLVVAAAATKIFEDPIGAWRRLRGDSQDRSEGGPVQ